MMEQCKEKLSIAMFGQKGFLQEKAEFLLYNEHEKER